MKSIRKQLKLLKTIRPDKDWKLELRNELFAEPVIFNPTSLEKVFASLALVGALIFAFLVNSFVEDLQRVQFSHLETEIVESERQVVSEETDKNKELLDYLISEVDIEYLDDYEKLILAKESTRALVEEIEITQERMLGILTAME